MLRRGDRVLVAVSGGPDSTALLSVLLELAEGQRLSVQAAHFNHHLRGEESDDDQRAVEELCDRFNVRLCVGAGSSCLQDGNVEERARIARYAFLTGAACELDCNRIATGHTCDDQAETVIMRLLRGSSLDGMSGIRAVRADGVIRPLIECQRYEVIEYLRTVNLPYCSDSMNADSRFLRTRVRQEVMPLLTAINPAAIRTFGRTASRFAREVELLDRFAADALAASAGEDGVLRISKLDLVPKPLRDRVVRRWLKQQRGGLSGIAAAHLDAVCALAERGGESRQTDLPGRGVVRRDYDSLRFLRGEEGTAKAFSHRVAAGASIDLDCGWHLSAELVSAANEVPAVERTQWHFWADADSIGGEMQLRNARKGDRIQPLGLAGHRKLQDVFVDRKLPRSQRWARPVLEAGGRILWVPGLVRSNHALISPATRAAWRVVIEASAVAGG